MLLPTLYSRTSTGAIQQWSIEVNGDSYRTIHGQVDGKWQMTEPTVCLPKNEGKKNATTGEDQALKEAKAAWKKKKESGCFEDINDIDISLFTEPMLAKKYEDCRDDLSFPLFSQKKLDGIRCVARKDGLWSRKGKKITSVPHIEEALKEFFEKSPDTVLDGELYCDKFANDFNAICSMVRKATPNAQELKACAESIQYWMYDVANPTLQFSDRTQLLYTIVAKLNNPVLKFVDTELVFDQVGLDSLYEQYIEAGYEGQMVRTNGKYEFKRSKNLLKRKEFQDAEYTVLEVVEGLGNRAGTAGAMIVRGDDGKQFRTNIKGSREYVKELLEQKNELVGKQVTIKFFNLTPDGIPRFPFVVGIRDFE